MEKIGNIHGVKEMELGRGESLVAQQEGVQYTLHVSRKETKC